MTFICWVAFAVFSIYCTTDQRTTKADGNTEAQKNELGLNWNGSVQLWSIRPGYSVTDEYELNPDAFPFLVMVKTLSERCSGVLLNKAWVVSSNYCHREDDKPLMYAGGIGYERGELKMSEGVQKVYADQQLEYSMEVENRLYLRHDVLLLHAEDPGFEVTRFVSPAIITNQRRFLVKSYWTCFVVGFGAYGRETLTMTSLMTSCPQYVPEEDTICSERSRWPCQGDAGAPLVCQKMLVGIVQTHQLHPNRKCRQKNLEGPARYTFLGYYTDWILENVQDVRFGVWDVGGADPVAWRSVVRVLLGALIMLAVLR